MANITFSILDLLFFTGFILLFFRVRNNGLLKEIVFISILFIYCYLTLNNLKIVHDYFDDGTDCGGDVGDADGDDRDGGGDNM